jgi:hypothetical protein
MAAFRADIFQTGIIASHVILLFSLGAVVVPPQITFQKW